MRKIILGVIFISVLILTGCPDPAPGGGGSVVNVSGVVLYSATLDLPLSMTHQFTFTVAPSNADNKNLTWLSSDVAVTTVDAYGLVSSISIGTSDITATSADGGFTDVCTVTVIPFVSVIGVSMSSPSETIVVDGTVQLNAVFDPVDASNQSVIWSSDNASAVVSSTGFVTGISVGSANITVKSVEGEHTDSCVVTVDPVVVTGVALDMSEIYIQPSETFQLTSILNPINATNQNVSWTSGDDLIATVNATTGLVTGVIEGSTNITVTTQDGGYDALCNVFVDSTSPELFSVSKLTSTKIAIVMTEEMSSVGITNEINYLLISDPLGAAVNVEIDFITTELNFDGDSVIYITATDSLPIGALSVTISSLTDLAGNVISTSNNPFTTDIVPDHGCVVDLFFINENAGVVSFDEGAITLPGGNWDPDSFSIYVVASGNPFTAGNMLAYATVAQLGSTLDLLDIATDLTYTFANGSYDIYVVGTYDTTDVLGVNFATMTIPII